jgi:hypothetical protein
MSSSYIARRFVTGGVQLARPMQSMPTTSFASPATSSGRSDLGDERAVLAGPQPHDTYQPAVAAGLQRGALLPASRPEFVGCAYTARADEAKRLGRFPAPGEGPRCELGHTAVAVVDQPVEDLAVPCAVPDCRRAGTSAGGAGAPPPATTARSCRSRGSNHDRHGSLVPSAPGKACAVPQYAAPE